MADQKDVIQVLRDALQAEEGWEYGDLLPVRTKGGKIDWGMPSSVRDTLSGLVDLLEGTRTGEVTGRGALALAGLGGAAGMSAPRGALGMFAGRQAKNAPLGDMVAANNLLKGAPQATHDKAWQVMGVGNNFADRGMRWEFSDEKLRVNPELRERLARKELTHLADAIEHPELFKNYPLFEGVYVTQAPGKQSYWNPNAGEIGLSDYLLAQSDPDLLRRTFAHEIQHGIDDIEKFARGSSPKEFLKIGRSEAEAMQDYFKTAGEIGARVTEQRLNYPEMSRRAIPPWVMFEVPIEEQLLLDPKISGKILNNDLLGKAR